MFLFLFIFTAVFAQPLQQPKNESCSMICVCEKDDMVWNRYGRSCGIFYTRCINETDCDIADAICYKHDKCVIQKSYEQSCSCNVEFINAINLARGPGWCDHDVKPYIMEDAAKAMHDDMCRLVLYSPIWLGGCPNSIIPKSCDFLRSHTHTPSWVLGMIVFIGISISAYIVGMAGYKTIQYMRLRRRSPILNSDIIYLNNP